MYDFYVCYGSDLKITLYRYMIYDTNVKLEVEKKSICEKVYVHTYGTFKTEPVRN